MGARRSCGWCMTAGVSLGLLAGCGQREGSQQAVRLDLPEDGTTVDCLVYVPRGYEERTEAWPLVLFLHGAGECGEDVDRVDQDGDGAVSAEEFQKQSPEALVLRMDLDQDGLLSLDEYEAANGTLVAGGRSRRIFAAWDGDGDGRLSLEEFAAKPPQVEFHQKDADADGRLTYEEYAPGVPADKVAAVRERFRTMDRDGDGWVTLREMTFRPADAGFGDRDRDGDGKLTPAEK